MQGMQFRKRAQSVGVQALRHDKPRTPTFGNKVSQQRPHPKVSRNGGLFCKLNQDQNEFLIYNSKTPKYTPFGIIELDEEHHQTIMNLIPPARSLTLQQQNLSFAIKSTVNQPNTQRPTRNHQESDNLEQSLLIAKLQEQLLEKREQQRLKEQISLQQQIEIFKSHQDYYETILKINKIPIDNNQKHLHPQFDLES